MSIRAGDLAQDAVTPAKMAHGPPGGMIGYDATGDPVAVALSRGVQTALDNLSARVSALEGPEVAGEPFADDTLWSDGTGWV